MKWESTRQKVLTTEVDIQAGYRESWVLGAEERKRQRHRKDQFKY